MDKPVKITKVEDFEALLNEFSPDILRDLETDNQELKALTVQKGLTILQKRKLDTNLAKTPRFWLALQNNMELFRARIIDEINNKLKADFNKEQRADYFFDYVDKNTDN